MIFELDGFEVMVMQAAHEIDAAIATFEPYVLLVDILLGNENGTEICNRLKGSSHAADIPIVLMSASEHFYDIEKETALADAFVSKSFDIHELIRVVAELINR